VEEVHLNLYKFVCQVCGKKCKKSGELYKHFRTTGHVNDKPEVAVQPEKKLDAKIVRPFLEKTGKDGDEQKKCKLCNYTDYSDDVMVEHFEANHREDLKKYMYDFKNDERTLTCVHCSTTAKNRAALMNHNCPEASKENKSADGPKLEQQQQQQKSKSYWDDFFTNENDSKYVCKLCDFNNNSIVVMVLHLKVEHRISEVQPEKLPESSSDDYVSTSKRNEGGKTHKCDFCHLVFYSFVESMMQGINHIK